jgi:oligopeptide transport system ATP-binding protein
MTTDTRTTSAETPALLQVRNVVQEFDIRDHAGVKGGVLQAVSDVSLDVQAGETLALVGETGSGKSTLARSIMQAPRPKAGHILFQGKDLMGLSRRELHRARRHLQMVFQNPYGSMDPRWTAADLIEEPLVVYGLGGRQERAKRVAQLLDLVGLVQSAGARRPRELSGGQCQRVAIARAIALDPALVICDEAVSSLDVLVQAQVLNLFEDLKDELGLAYLFIAHDLALVKQVSDSVAVMYLGKLCEIGPAEDVYAHPAHPYTQALLDSIPSPTVPDESYSPPPLLAGDLPSALDPPSGCRFRTRCPRARERCATEVPELRPTGLGQSVACHFPLTEPAAPTAGG